MRFFNLLSFSAAVTSVTAQYIDQIGPFKLSVGSDDPSVNGKFLGACHAGAALEILCILNSTDTPSTFYYNYSASSNQLSSHGFITYLLKGVNVYEPMSLIYNTGSNVAGFLFGPGSSSSFVGFDSVNQLYVPVSIDDTKTPIENTGYQKAYYRFYACTASYMGRSFHSLAWVMGSPKPQNPTCVAVKVYRVF